MNEISEKTSKIWKENRGNHAKLTENMLDAAGDVANTNKDSEKEEITCEITHDDNKMLLEFYSNTGRFGTEELLDDYVLTSEQLLDILQEWRDKSCEDDTYGL